ncbi:MAG TPA: carboxypeptidase regulatory-like domain-containing protein [Gemmatimonadaceae bacterium]|nr:carboxypeptidase regulatory-like domain-containing protein [Gemmatimonadaceae bacterium]
MDGLTSALIAWRALLLLGLIALPCESQETSLARVSGTVRDSSGHPIALARLVSASTLAVTDSAGRFSLGGLSGGAAAVTIRRLGYAPLDTTVSLAVGRTESLHVVLALLPHDLPGITIDQDEILRTRLPDYYRHRATGNGFFFDRRDIESRNVQYITDLLRNVPGLRLGQDRSGRATVRNARSVGACPPDVWVDGIRAEGFSIDDIGVHDVEALEVYRGPSGLPPELNDRLGHPACGSIVIWTRLP